jgi:serine/threonine-protein kinase
VPFFMTLKLVRRGKSLRLSGLRLRRVFLSRSSRSVIFAAPQPSERQLRKLVPLAVLESAHGMAVRRAAEDRAAILAIIGELSKADRAMLPEIGPTVNGLVDRVAKLAQLLHQLDGSGDQFAESRAALERQLASAGSALADLRIDLIKLQTSGLEAALGEVSSATQEARALSREIGMALEAAAEVRDI